MNLLRLIVGSIVLFIGALILPPHDERRQALAALERDRLNEAKDKIAGVTAEVCPHPEDDRLDAARMGAPKATICGLCQKEFED